MAIALAGCGGGGGVDVQSPPATLPTAQLQGIWSGTIGSDQASAVVMSDGRGWLIANSTPIKLYTAVLQGGTASYSGSGKQYAAGTAGAADIALTTTMVLGKAILRGNITPVGGLPTAYDFTYQSRYETPATLADLSGTWRGSQAAGALVLEWLIDATGALKETANNSNGCLYTGKLAVHAVPSPVGLYGLSLRESCTNLGVTQVKDFEGIATLSASSSQTTFAFSRSDAGFEGTEAVVQFAAKQ